MKNYLLLLFILPLCVALSSCGSDGGDGPQDGTGTISVTCQVTNGEGETVDLDNSALTLILTGPENKKIPFPADGVVENLTIGNYTVEVRSHADGMPAPAHESPYYSGTATAVVISGKTTDVSVACGLKNSGVMFEYHESLAKAGFHDIVMTVAQEGSELTFADDSSDKCGYFRPGTVNVMMRNGERDLAIAGDLVHARELVAGKIYRMTAYVEGVALTVTIEDVSDPTSAETMTVDDENIPVADYRMTRVKTSTMYWNPETDDPVRFDLSVVTEDGITELWLRGFTAPVKGDKFYLAEGTYNISALEGKTGSDYGAAMTLTPGHHTVEAYMPTTGFKWTDNLIYIDDAYYAQSGLMTLRRDGDGYFITADFTGDADIWTGWAIETRHDVRKIYSIRLSSVPWENGYVSPGDLEYDDVPTGSYQASGGTNVFYDNDGPRGPDTWTGSLDTAGEYGWVISKWSDLEGLFFLDYDHKRMWVSDYGETIVDKKFLLVFGGAYLDNEGSPVLCWRPEAGFIKETNTIDFTRKHPNGRDIGICGVFDYGGGGYDYYLATDIYMNMKLSITPSRGAMSMSGNPPAFVSPVTKLIPMKVDRNWDVHRTGRGYAYPVDGLR